MQHKAVLRSTGIGLGVMLACTGAPAQAQEPGRGAECFGPAAYLAPGQTQTLAPGAVQRFTVDLGDAERVEIELAGIAANPPSTPVPAPPLEVCDIAGMTLAVETVLGGKDKLTLRFTAPAAGRYTLAATAAMAERRLTVRSTRAPYTDAIPLILGHTVFARLAPQMPRAWSFEGKVGQWVRIAATSQTDTAIHLIGPGADGKAAVLGEDDDSEGLNPLIQRKLHIDGTYVVEVQSLGEESDDITLDVRELPAPPPPAPPVLLRPGETQRAALTSIAERMLYDVAVRAGHVYKIEASAAFDLALDVGLADPLEPINGTLASGISVQRTIDSTRSGAEVTGFTATADGHVLLRIRGLGIDEGGEDFTVTLTDTGK